MYIDIWFRYLWLIHLCSATVVSWPHCSHWYLIQFCAWPVCRLLVNSLMLFQNHIDCNCSKTYLYVCILCAIWVIVSNCIDYGNQYNLEVKKILSILCVLVSQDDCACRPPHSAKIACFISSPHCQYLSIDLFCDFHNSWRFGKTSAGRLISAY